MKEKIEMKLTQQEVANLLTSVLVCNEALDKIANPQTDLALQRLAKRLWAHSRKYK